MSSVTGIRRLKGIILGSSSSSRKLLLQEGGISIAAVVKPRVEEREMGDRSSASRARELVELLGRVKGEDVMRQIREARREGRLQQLLGEGVLISSNNNNSNNSSSNSSNSSSSSSSSSNSNSNSNSSNSNSNSNSNNTVDNYSNTTTSNSNSSSNSGNDDGTIPELDGYIVLTGDQVVCWDDTIMEKPIDREEAIVFMNRYHISPVSTVGSIVLTDASTGKQVCSIDRCVIVFREIERGDIDRLIEEGEVMYCAGALMIENERIRPYIDRIDGTEEGVRGLCLQVLDRLIRELGYCK